MYCYLHDYFYFLPLNEYVAGADAQKSAMNEELMDLQRQLADARSQADGIKRDIDRCSFDLKGKRLQ